MRSHPHFLLLTWLLTAGLVTFGFVVCIDQGLLQWLLAVDQSNISWVVLAMYAVGLAHSFLRTVQISRELNRTAELERMIETAGPTILSLSDEGEILADGKALPKSFLSSYWRDVYCARGSGDAEANVRARDALLEAGALALRGPQDFGWYFIDTMLKVGFLGTLIGFILMLGSISGSANLDASMLQHVLQKMSYGMSTALNTTLISLVAGILLSIHYHLLDRGLEELLSASVKLSETKALPLLDRGRS